MMMKPGALGHYLKILISINQGTLNKMSSLAYEELK